MVLLLASGIFALMRGFVYETLAMAGWVAAGLAAFWGLPYTRPFTSKYISSPTVADVAGGVALFLVVLLVSSLITHAISRSVQKSAISSVDRSLGFAFGLARGLVLASLVFILVTKLMAPGEPQVLTNAKTRPLLAFGAHMLQSLVPAQLSTIEDKARAAQDAASQAQKMQDMYERLNSPRPVGADQTPAAPAANGAAAPAAKPAQKTEATPSYDNRGLERLIETTK